MKMKYIIYLALVVLLAACSKEGVGDRQLADASLLGRAVNFQASVADPFATRTTYRHNGAFNEGDLMTIYRQYSDDAGITFNVDSAAYRVYHLRTRYATGTSIALETDWVPKEGKRGYDPVLNPKSFIQTEADSLTWDNGKTVRFRAWSRNNLRDCISRSATDKGQYYPDYSIAEWVTVSGPTLAIPLTLKHQGCRIGFTPKGGNELFQAEICTDVADYMWKDNSTGTSHDESTSEHGKTLADAQAEADLVKAAYDRMCMPAGVDINTSLLTTMTQTLYNTTTDFSDISTSETGIVNYDTYSPDWIRDNAQRALFTRNLDGRLYMISIPYDMSTGPQKGESIILPACTRIRVWLYDSNDGDRANTHDYEANYHIFTLGDIKDGNGQVMFPNGMELMPGVSYLFTVGYYYDQFTITPADHFSWDEQSAVEGDGTNRAEAQPDTRDYSWWKNAIKAAIPKNISESFQPVFHLTDEQYQCMCDIIRLLTSVSQLDIDCRNEAIASIIDTLSLMTDEFRQKADSNSSHSSDVGRNYFNHFYECLVNHYRESREVRYYARQLCLSPKYFGTIIKQETGVSAGEWIARYIIIRAKTLLRYRPDLTIQQICLQLGFPDAATFTRYFKTNEGVTPKAYREQTMG